MAAAGSGATVVTRATAAAGHRTGQEGEAGGGRRGVVPTPSPLTPAFGRLLLPGILGYGRASRTSTANRRCMYFVNLFLMRLS